MEERNPLTGESRPEDPECRVNRGLYWAGAGMMLPLVGGFLASLASPGTACVFIFLGLAWLPPALWWMRIALGPERFAAGREGLVLYNGVSVRTIPWGAVTGLQSHYQDEKARGAHPVRIVRASGSPLWIPRWLRDGGRRFHDALVARATETLAARHAPDPAGGQWPLYAGAAVPPPLADILADLRVQGRAADACLFRGPVYKRPVGLASARWVLGILAVGCVVGAAVTSDEEARPGFIGMAVVLGVALAACLAHGARRRGKPQWLLIHSRGLAMLGKELTGELHWGELKSVRHQRTNHCLLKTFDGAAIKLSDVYDAPLAAAEKLIRDRLARFESEVHKEEARRLAAPPPPPQPAPAEEEFRNP